MWLLAAWVLLSAVGHGSARLYFHTISFVERTACNKTVILPCYVSNLQLFSVKYIFVTWKKEGNRIFAFDGSKNEFFRHSAYQSASLLSDEELAKGIASLKLKGTEAGVGNYSCEVTESNREGETTVELRSRPVEFCEDDCTPAPEEIEEICGSWFLLMERAIIIALLFLVNVLCLAQLSVIVLKYDTVTQKKIVIILASIIVTVAAVVGTVLFVQEGYSVQNQTGLGLVVVPAVFLVLVQYFMFGIVFDSPPQATFALIGLQILGYMIAVVGFALCVSACPPLHGSVVIAGLAIMAIATLLSLAYVFIMELKSNVMCKKYIVVHTPWP
ncbi:leukocyte surface antigen CD47 isoform X3 [Colius striatus]|uniref:leukocyte surface antigen CD47 isoform X3 n=1 Tax=Colius striatus TaxID=57412 RepID=UPI002B1D9E67|nr:leukocyte surface antigen CD47 isoform X3 [Colius striatus]